MSGPPQSSSEPCCGSHNKSEPQSCDAVLARRIFLLLRCASGALADDYGKPRFTPTNCETMTLALFGYLTLYRKVIQHHGVRLMLDHGVFDKSLRSGSTVQLLLNHQSELCVGSTNDILELHSDFIGLAMRARLPDTEHGRTARWMAENGHDDASIGFNDYNARTEIRRIDGLDVTCIVEADLFEGSYLFGKGLGAVKESYITFGDVDFSRSLKDECSSYLYHGAAVGFKRALQKLCDSPA